MWIWYIENEQNQLPIQDVIVICPRALQIKSMWESIEN